VSVARSPAGALFVMRAQAALPAFELTENNAPAVAAVCTMVDGLPLAIELAASWTRVLDPASLVRHLQHRLGRLEIRAHDAPARHRTLWAAIAWSYDRLTTSEQAACRRLAVFAGDWTAAAMESVTEAHGSLEILGSFCSARLTTQATLPGDAAMTIH
jgi:predicted ATPase